MKPDISDKKTMSRSTQQRASNEEDHDESVEDLVTDFPLNLKVIVVLVALMNASNLLVWFYTALKYQAEMFTNDHWSHPVMIGVKAMYTLSFFAAWY